MAETRVSRNWVGSTVFLVLALVIIFVQLIPLDVRPGRWAAPDVLLVVTLAWVARRPDYAPVWLIAAIFLLCDLLFQRPPGLWTALVVILTEFLRARTRGIRDMPLPLEWGSVAMGIVAITLANRVAMVLVMMPLAPLGLTLIQMIMTIFAYPLVVLVAHVAFGVSRAAPGQVDQLGRRI